MTPLAERDEAIARWERHRATGRTRFIWRHGVLGWGLPAALLVIIYRIIQEQGFVAPPELTESLLSTIRIALAVFPLCGWIFGRWLWTTGEARYRVMTHDAGFRASHHTLPPGHA